MRTLIANDWKDLVGDDEARRCARCGQRTAFAARTPKAVTLVQDLSAAVAEAGVVWFCFECGHEERKESDRHDLSKAG